MKKAFIILLLISPFLSFGSNLSDLFSFDKNKIEVEMSELTEIETYATANELDYKTAYQANPSLFNLESEINTTSFMIYADPPLGIPSFAWGFCCGFAGIGIVYFMTEDRDETKKALYGCVANVVISAVVYVALIGAAASSGTVYYYY